MNTSPSSASLLPYTFPTVETGFQRSLTPRLSASHEYLALRFNLSALYTSSTILNCLSRCPFPSWRLVFSHHHSRLVAEIIYGLSVFVSLQIFLHPLYPTTVTVHKAQHRLLGGLRVCRFTGTTIPPTPRGGISSIFCEKLPF